MRGDDAEATRAFGMSMKLIFGWWIRSVLTADSG
jgi:hypothetical protein